jgi:hypothetical protein
MTFLARHDFSTLQDRMNCVFREAFSPEGSESWHSGIHRFHPPAQINSGSAQPHVHQAATSDRRFPPLIEYARFCELR